MSMKKTNKNIDADEFNMLVDECETWGIKYEIKNYSTSVQLETNSRIYRCSLTGEVKDIVNTGAIATAFYKYLEPFDLRYKYGYSEGNDYLDGKKIIRWDYKIASGYQYYNEDFVLKDLKCWSYDINSAYSYAMLSPMPDTRVEPRYNDIVRRGEIGFYKGGGATTEVGEFAEIIFPLIDSPFKEYVFTRYQKKKCLNKGPERDKVKKELNFATGLIARRNIFMRNAIIYYSNRYIQKFIDEDTVYCNIDCIVSLRPRYDLPIGNEIGQFKVEHECDDFKYKKSCIYQWGPNDVHYAGVPRNTISDIENLGSWQDNLKYKYDIEKRKVVLRNA